MEYKKKDKGFYLVLLEGLGGLRGGSGDCFCIDTVLLLLLLPKNLG